MVVPLSSSTERRLLAMFRDARQREQARQLLEDECSDRVPGWFDVTAAGLERIRFAVLKLSNGSLAKLSEALSLANLDWRDALVAAGFADDVKAHLAWRPE
jgi:hypothetical protein